MARSSCSICDLEGKRLRRVSHREGEFTSVCSGCYELAVAELQTQGLGIERFHEIRGVLKSRLPTPGAVAYMCGSCGVSLDEKNANMCLDRYGALVSTLCSKCFTK